MPSLFDPLSYRYSSKRNLVLSTNGMVATSHPLAAQAGLSVLRKGGNAVDAAIATAMSLTVLEPTSNGIGGDSFAQVWFDGDLYGLNSSGPSPNKISRSALEKRGFHSMPKFGWEPVTVPGIPAAWAELSSRFGVLSLRDVAGPAIDYAERGYPIQPTLGKYWRKAYNVYSGLEGVLFESWLDTFTLDGEPPQVGDVWRSLDHAETLRSIAKTDANSFYQGKLAEKIDQFSRETGGFLRGSDLSSFEPKWVDPITVNYRGYDVWELPPNGQGLVSLIALNILSEYDLNPLMAADYCHKQIESIKLAFMDGKKYITDPKYMDVSYEEFLGRDCTLKRKKQIGEGVMEPEGKHPGEKGTVYLATADGQGNMVSYIQSNYMGFGSGLVVPGTGIALQNRGNTFSLDPGDANSLEPGKRTYHTIIPGFLTKGNRPIGPFGVMGGYMQPQGHLQLLCNILDRGLNPQSALDAPRWRWDEGKKVEVEQWFPRYLAEALDWRGHKIGVALDSGSFGRGQMIWKDEKVLFGATEPRTDGCVASY